jgi:uncharacterized membrane protein (UPF0127 family)
MSIKTKPPINNDFFRKIFFRVTPFYRYITIISLLSALLFINVVCKKDNISSKVDSTSNKKYNIVFVKQGEVYFQDSSKKFIKEVDVEIADNEDKRHIGLMFRDRMEENQGMLFIFPTEEQQAFYMKNTIIPLDIIFINSKKQIVKIHKNTTPYSEKDLLSGKPVLYVVEVSAGFTDKYTIKEGGYIDWRRN